MSKTKQKVEETVDMCGIPREVAVKHLNDLIAKNKDVFDMYFLWANVLNTQINIIKEPNLLHENETKN